ncbi:MAG: acyl-CoA dehydrogenase [Lentisphaerae bacterium RIFOXYA12_FULL_48_11]|nr:MAG: acyl-CoA dehydrogenase [Lentisphaerae bacterium RIFOXYA12_FULL_48_11]
MENFFRDNDDILFHFKNMNMDELIRLREDGFVDKDKFAYAPSSVEDTKDSYERVLDIMGGLAAEYLAPYAAEVDAVECQFENGVVTYPASINRAVKMFAKADLMGLVLPRKYGGLNMPAVVVAVAAEVLSRADGSFLSYGLHQDNGATINKFASEEIKNSFLPRFCTGEFESSMVLTEPEAGSDLQAVALKATQGVDGKWYLNGVKRFITNGCAQIALVLARSEEGSKGGRGLSFFLYERDEHMKVRRIEHKLGIRGSATCELQFNNAPALLVGERRYGLAKYTMWLMNQARLGIAGQALGIAESAYREADKYAKERMQFGKKIREITPVMEMLAEMKIAIEAARTLYYETAKVVDLKEGYEEAEEKHPEKAAEYKEKIKLYAKYAALLTPITKACCTELANKIAYDAIQIHGGPGYMREFNVERHYRDARITNIYEGTTQLQIVAAIGGVVSGAAKQKLDELDKLDFGHSDYLLKRLRELKRIFEDTINFVVGKNDARFQEYHSRRMVEMATDLLQGYLLMRDGKYSDRKKIVAETFIDKMGARVEMNSRFIIKGDASLLRNFPAIIG